MSDKIQKYFAAANSFNGFISFFKEIFNSEDYEKIYVIKGGPGTGKSSLMRRILQENEKNADEIEEIYCSSDPHSLDGVIIRKNSKQIAFIDGTSPHERDANLPALRDELINLASNIDRRFMKAKGDDILELNREKAKAYRTAYSYLAQAGQSASFINSIYKDKFNRKKAKYKAESIFDCNSTEKSTKYSTRLISSFGKYGSYGLRPHFDNKIKVNNDDFTSNILLDYFVNFLKFHDLTFRRFPFALSPNHSDCVFVNNANLAIIKDDTPDIDASEYFSLTAYDKETVKTAKSIYSTALDEAVRWFNIASDFHFRLEEIYSSAMNFEKNNEIASQISSEVANILQ